MKTFTLSQIKSLVSNLEARLPDPDDRLEIRLAVNQHLGPGIVPKFVERESGSRPIDDITSSLNRNGGPIYPTEE